jgi:hypothetical protein
MISHISLMGDRPLRVGCGKSTQFATSSDWQHARLVRTAGFGQKRSFISSSKII